MEEIILNKIEWSAPEYKYESKSVDFLWTIGLVSIVAFIVAFWFQNYLFSIFILISGASLILFSIRHPREVTFVIETEGLKMGRDQYKWKDVKGFDIKKDNDSSLLLVEIKKYILPVYTIPFPAEKTKEIRDNLIKVIPAVELEESKSVKFMEKLGF